MEGRKQSELLVNANIPFLKNCETRFFRVGNRKRLCHLRRVDLGNNFADGFAAKRAMGQSGAVNRTAQLEFPLANFAAPAIGEFVFVNRHNKDEQKKTRNEAGNGIRKKSRGGKPRKKTARRAIPKTDGTSETRNSRKQRKPARLPARFRHARDKPCRGEFAEGDTGKFETTHESTTPARNLTAIHQTGRACIAGKHRQADIVAFRLQLRTQRCVFLYSFLFAFITLKPRCFCHRSRKPRLKSAPSKDKIQFFFAPGRVSKILSKVSSSLAISAGCFVLRVITRLTMAATVALTCASAVERKIVAMREPGSTKFV